MPTRNSLLGRPPGSATCYSVALARWLPRARASARSFWLFFGLTGVCLQAAAQSVALQGSLGDKALLIIDGVPRTVAVGTTVQGVRLVRLQSGQAVVEQGGRQLELTLGASPANLGGAPSGGGGSRIAIAAGPGGHFSPRGSINGKAVQFVVDTGATSVALSQDVADQIGLNWRAGSRTFSQTANGPVVVHVVSLNEIRIGDVTVYGVEAVVLPSPLPVVLLGNTYLRRFSMLRESDTLVLTKTQ